LTKQRVGNIVVITYFARVEILKNQGDKEMKLREKMAAVVGLAFIGTGAALGVAGNALANTQEVVPPQADTQITLVTQTANDQTAEINNGIRDGQIQVGIQDGLQAVSGTQTISPAAWNPKLPPRKPDTQFGIYDGHHLQAAGHTRDGFDGLRGPYHTTPGKHGRPTIRSVDNCEWNRMTCGSTMGFNQNPQPAQPGTKGVTLVSFNVKASGIQLKADGPENNDPNVRGTPNWEAQQQWAADWFRRGSSF
jgi:hypothetical protein